MFTVSIPRARTCLRRRRLERGAMLVESLVVSSCFILGLLGLIYFKELYLKKLGTQRLSRAAVIAHSMVACKGNQPGQWLGRDTLDYDVGGANASNATARASGATANYADNDTSGGSRAPRILSRVKGTTSDGQGVLNPMTDALLTGRASVSPRGASQRKGSWHFEGQVASQSFVSCADEVKKGDYGEIIPMLKEEFRALLNEGGK